jgi:hypothetical protein
MKFSLKLSITLLIQVCFLHLVKANEECEVNSFDIVIDEKEDIHVEYQTIKIDFLIKIKKDILTKNESQYATKCLKEIIFEYKLADKDGITSITVPYKALKSSAVFNDLKYLSEYELDIKYVQTDGLKYKAQKLQNIITCFGRPTELTDFKWNQTDKETKITWSGPKKINAPDVCSYLILIINTENGALDQIFQEKKEKNEFVYNGDRTNTDIFISACNEDKCYKNTYPSVEKCVHKKTFGRISKVPSKNELISNESSTESSTESYTTVNTSKDVNSNTPSTAANEITSQPPTNSTNNNKNKAYILESNVHFILLLSFILTILVV